MEFSTDKASILARIDRIDPVAYGRSRNFVDGAVTYLSPYISRGFISTKQVMERMMARGFAPFRMEKLLQELAWRDYFQRVAQALPDLTEKDIRQPQPRAERQGIPTAILAAQTGIEGIDQAIEGLYRSGYMHNHCRMYTASLVCNLARCHWSLPARWLYYHLLDADFASNACSWQWVAGAFSSKLYFANQENVNKYCHTKQSDTILAHSYEVLPAIGIPSTLQEVGEFDPVTKLPATGKLSLDPAKPTLIYNFYNLDPDWRKEEPVNRILLLEPAHFSKFPVSERSIDFMLALSANIEGLQVFTGSFSELKEACAGSEMIFKEHPLFSHYEGRQDPRDWMFPKVEGYHQSFFAYWNKCLSQLKKISA